MKKILIILVCTCIVYIFLTQQIHILGNNDASLIMSATNITDTKKLVISTYNKTILLDSERLTADTEVRLETAYINTDNEKDIIATIQSNKTCGTGGCVTSILLKNILGEFEPIHFNYAVKKIEVENSVTNGMHDLRINENKENLLIWNGERYSFNNF